jgi:hypothetical protein
MPTLDTQPELPWSGKTPRSRHNSYKAAVAAQSTRAFKSARYLAWLKDVGQATDWGAVDHFGWPMSTVCSVRNGLVDRGLVHAVGDCIGKYGKSVTIWSAKE